MSRRVSCPNAAKAARDAFLSINLPFSIYRRAVSSMRRCRRKGLVCLKRTTGPRLDAFDAERQQCDPLGLRDRPQAGRRAAPQHCQVRQPVRASRASIPPQCRAGDCGAGRCTGDRHAAARTDVPHRDQHLSRLRLDDNEEPGPPHLYQTRSASPSARQGLGASHRPRGQRPIGTTTRAVRHGRHARLRLRFTRPWLISTRGDRKRIL